ncbi:agamous-like MADS-box protein AGL62 [Coccinella septempunctata]|uniref:agamous-like MADS-box protein AGL62 n=1 Tax=Coccinella septempunctata TaxID=41139 RepID=UPI001D0806A2|nr:agamous-like MADS-box protein AGL62 [Coccinella septempunctata]
MFKALVFCIPMILGLTLAAVETNKRGGHGIFHGLEEAGGKSSWLEETKVDSVKISKGNANSLLSNTDPKSKKSSIYLQPEPRGLEYLLDVPDHNPLLTNFYRRRRATDKYELNKIRNIRQINLQPGNVIPGSRGQAVLYGVPNGGVPSYQNGGFPQGSPNQNSGVPQGIPSGPYQNGGFPEGIPSRPYQNGGPPQGPDSHYGGYRTYGY